MPRLDYPDTVEESVEADEEENMQAEEEKS
jgi:hypothetical protein